MKDETAQSDYGREYCGREDRHPYELFLQLEEIEHRRRRWAIRSQTGPSSALHHALLDEHLRRCRPIWSAYLKTHDRNHPHCGRGVDGRTPYQVFKKGIRKPRSRKKSTKKEVRTAA